MNDSITAAEAPPVTPAVSSASPQTGTPAHTFTQADVDRIIGERLSRAKLDAEQVRTETAASLLKKLGAADETEAAALVKAAKESERLKLSETERVQADLEALKAEKIAAETRANEAIERSTRLIRDTSLKAALTTAATVDVDTALLLLTADPAKTFLDKDGKPDEKLIADEIDALKKSKAYLFQSQSTYKGFGSTKAGANPTPGMSKDEAAKAALWKNMRRG